MRSDTIGSLLRRRLVKEMTMCVSAFFLCIAAAQSAADDTEIFVSANQAPNVLFVLDVSASMKEIDDDDGLTRLEKVKAAIKVLLNTNEGFNAGLLTYSGSNIRLRNNIMPVTEARDDLLASLEALKPSGGTLTQSAVYEGLRYYRGDTSMAGTPAQTYVSPITQQCQSNHIVLLSDGIPTEDPIGHENISAGIGRACTRVDIGNRFTNGTCGVELTEYLRDNDHSQTVDGFNNITTHTVGLNFSDPWLADIATGGSFTADSAEGLLDAFAAIVEVAQSDSNSFVTPSVTVDQFSRLSHREDTYLALFQPGGRTQWTGNLKRYSFSGDPAVLRDRNGQEALDGANGTFRDTAHSFWSDTVDGAAVGSGGAANELDVATRKVYTYTGNANLNHYTNAVHEDNETKLAPLFGPTPVALAELLKWTRGVDIKDDDEDGLVDDTRLHMGDPLHSIPTVLNYGGTSANPDSVVFVGTNEGYLHAINSDDGTELYSFIPPELLGNLGAFYQNHSNSRRTYGLDGDITLWVDDKNNDGTLDPASERAYLYVGMRRGGNNYYALDVTNKNDPKFLWSIKGGTSEFPELGQSWSKPTLTKVKMDNKVKDVLVFGGGYDPLQDYSTIKSADTRGRSLFIVDATDGSLLWTPDMDTQSDYSEMVYSMPSDPRLLDVDDDGLVDQIYIGDMGGQLWRFDLKNDTSTAADSVTGGRIASLSGQGIANNRRFFYPPDVAITAQNGEQYLSVSIGSGNRAHPLDESVDNRFYMIRQEDIFNAPAEYGIRDTKDNSYGPIEEADLYDATANDVDSADTAVSLNAQQALEGAAGWRLNLTEPGEKVLSSSITVENTILFATYIPAQENLANPCAPSIGGGRAYVVSLFDATPANGPTVTDRHQQLEQPGIAGGPSVVILENGSVEPRVGFEPVEMPEISLTKRVYWSEESEY